MSSNGTDPTSLDPPALEDLALLADGERGALVTRRGEVVWLCFPRWHDDAVIGALVGAPGSFVVRPNHPALATGRYEPGTLIWCTRWVGDGPRLECRDALVLPSTSGTTHLLRRVHNQGGAQSVHVRIELAAGFGEHRPQGMRLGTDGVWRARLGEVEMLVSGVPEARWEGGALLADMFLADDEQRDLVLSLSVTGALVPLAPEPAWARTRDEWRRRVPAEGSGYAARDVQHSVAVLEGLTSQTGAMVAAATLGLPERTGAGRNYDYRYAWVRDQCIVGLAAARREDGRLLDAATRFVSGLVLEHGGNLAPAYRVDGGDVPIGRRLELSGYPGGADVVGNDARSQFQLDAWGDVLLLLASADEHGRLDDDGVAAATSAAEVIGRRFEEPDAGIWELDPHWWAQSRLQCVAGLRALARRPFARSSTDAYLGLADVLLDHTTHRSLHPDGRWQRAPDLPGVDAALLLPGVRGALPPDDPRSRATLLAVLRDLADDGYCYRFRHDDRPLGDAEGAFQLAGLTVALALLDAGDHAGAITFFERARGSVGPAGLLTEEVDVAGRRLRGNVPQAFVHGLLLEVAHRLDSHIGG